MLAPVLAPACALVAARAGAAEVTGYIDSRTQATDPRAQGLVPTDDLPIVHELLEANVQVKQPYAEGAFVYGDLSLFTQAAGTYRGQDAEGEEVVVPPHDVPANRPFVSLSELYVSHDVVPELSLLAGRKRVVWGSGLAWNPTDLLNPRKDPTDPSLQRAGAWMARVEVPLERFTFTLLGSPLVTGEASGIPSAFLVYPSWDARGDGEAHYLLAARAYALVADSDVNGMLFFGNRYGDAFEEKPRLGLSFSRYFFDDYELHVEALVQQGSARRYVNGACVDDPLVAAACFFQGTPVFSASRLDDDELLPKVLAGTRYQFSDETMISLEWLWQADGYTRGQLQDWVDALALVRTVRRLGVPLDPLGAGEGTQGGLPQKLAFEPLSRHTLFVTVQKPKIRDDFTAQLVVLASLTDLSGLLSPSLSWSTTEWLTLALAGFVPFPGPGSLAAKDPDDGAAVFEYTLLPMELRGLFEARVFY